MYKLTYHVPASHLEVTKSAIFAAGAGAVGNYDQCCWQVLGQGQFRPKKGSDPFIGEVGEVEVVEEYHVETVCTEDVIQAAVDALRQAHPYEHPSYAVLKLEPF